MDKLKKTIVFLIPIIIVVTIIICILFLNKTNNSTDYNLDTEFEKKDTYQISTKLEKVKIRNKYFAIRDIANRYIEAINQLNGEDNIDDGKNSLFQMLDKEYKSEFNITLNTLARNYSNYEKNEQMNIKEIYIAEKSSSINIYLLRGINLVQGTEFNLMIKTDSLNSTFSIFPEEYMKKYQYSIQSSLEEIKVSESSIEKNEFNQFKYKNIKDEYVAVEYFNRFKKMLYVDSEEVYNNLEQDYQKKRFGSLQKFNNFLKNNQSDLLKIELKSYLVNFSDDGKEYICKDQYNNIYIFKEKAIMDFSISLDTYTLETDKFKQTYHAADTQKKVMMNIDKWIMMLNSRDYEAAYQVLDETFKKNTFGSATKFEQYMRKQYPLHYTIEYKEYKEEANISIFTIKLSDITKENDEVKELKIIMQVKDDTDFTMSFEL